MSQKRERSINFTREEVDILIKLVEAKKHIIENKKSDAVTWNQKKKCWKSIEVSFNAVSGSTHRTSKNLRLKYEGIKRAIRKKSALLRAETYRTGEPRTEPVLTPNESKVKNMILGSVDGMESNFDSDSLHSVEIIKSPSSQLERNKENVEEETPINPAERTLHKFEIVETQDLFDLGDEGSDTVTPCSHWKPTSLRSRKHHASCKTKLKRPFEKVAASKMEITILQKKILEEEYVSKKRQWAFEEEERQHKREMWTLEKKLLLKKINDT